MADSGSLHFEMNVSQPSEYWQLFESVSNLVNSKKFDKEIAKLIDDSVMKQVFTEEQLKQSKLKDQV